MNTTPRKKRNFIGAADCRVWCKCHLALGTFYTEDENGEIPAAIPDTEIAKRFGVSYNTAQGIRKGLAIPTFETRVYILSKTGDQKKPGNKMRPVDIYNTASAIGVTIILAAIIVYLLTR